MERTVHAFPLIDLHPVNLVSSYITLPVHSFCFLGLSLTGNVPAVSVGGGHTFYPLKVKVLLSFCPNRQCFMQS